MRRLALVSGSVALGLVGVLAAPAGAQGPGIPNQAYPENQLFTIISSFGSGSYGHHFLHRGYVASLKSGAGVEFYNFSNPYSPTLVNSFSGGANGMDLSEPHTYVQTSAWGGGHVILARGPGGLGGTGFVISDWSNVFAPVTRRAYNVPTVTGGYTSGTFWLFGQAPYVYVPVGSLGLAIVDATDPENPFVVNHVPKSRLGGFNTVLAFAIGNELILTNSDGGPGFGRYDISIPFDPIPVYTNPTTPIPYGAQVNAGQIVVPAVSGPVAEPTGQNGSFHIHDMFTPGFPEVGGANMPSRGGSTIVQDQFVHVASSTAYIKFDVSNLANIFAVGTTSQPISGGDWDWVSPMGNFAILGDDQGQGSHVIPHLAVPDTTPPRVTMVVPADGATAQAPSTRVGITMSDMIDMDTINTSTFIVRPVGGQALDGTYSNQCGILNFWPAQQLQIDTDYEVVVPAGGMRDWAGNPTDVAFTSQFRTGQGGGLVSVIVDPNPPILVGNQVTVNATPFGIGPFQFSWDFGDGTPPTAFSSNSQATHTYTSGGHFSVQCTVSNGPNQSSDSYIQTVRYPPTTNRPTHSSTIAVNEVRRRVYCVNPDNDSVASIHQGTKARLREKFVGDHPRTLAFAPNHDLWVVCQDDATIHVVHPLTNETLAILQLPTGSAPYGVAMSPDETAAYVTLSGTGQVAKFHPATRQWIATVNVGPDPRGIAVSADSQRIFVTRHVSRSRGLPPDGAFDGDTGGDLTDPFGEVYELSAAPFAPAQTFRLAFDPGPDTEASGRGVPNYLGSPTISPDGRRLWVPSKKDNVARGVFRDGHLLGFDSTVRTIMSQVDLTTDAEDLPARIDFNDRDMAVATVFSRLGDYTFTVLQGSNAVDVRDTFSGDIAGDIPNTGLAPQGLALADDDTLYVHNFMSRSVSMYDVSGVTSSTSFQMPLITITSTVVTESLAPDVLLGKQIFYNAEDPRMNEDGYISCASCHLDGGQDGQVWDFTQRGEGLRNTISLLGRAGTAHGRVHWTANFDEIQDFENDIRSAFGGDGFMNDALFNSGTVSNPLGQPKAGLSTDLDALAAYVASLVDYGASPHRQMSGGLTPAGQRGRTLFNQLNCAQCHSGQHFTDGQTHAVGTFSARSGKAMGGRVHGFDTPTLRGLWNTAPYLHDGSAETLLDVFRTRNRRGRHGATGDLSPAQLRDLVAYLLQIDDNEPAPQ